MTPHRGLGAWIDVYDWTNEFAGATPSVDLTDIDAMADAGVQTVYVQTSHDRSSADVIEPARLDELIDRAHGNDMHVVAWYLPTYVDVDRDLQRLLAAAELPVDGLGVDIEATDVADPAERSQRVIDLSARLRSALGDDKALAAITLSGVHLQVVNPEYWPGYPWAEIGCDLRRRLADGLLVAPSGRAPVRVAVRRREHRPRPGAGGPGGSAHPPHRRHR